MAEDIQIPSPSVFLRRSPSPPRPRDDQPPAAKNARRQSTKKAPVRKQSAPAASVDGPPKPKQSKSRNGMCRGIYSSTKDMAVPSYARGRPRQNMY